MLIVITCIIHISKEAVLNNPCLAMVAFHASTIYNQYRD